MLAAEKAYAVLLLLMLTEAFIPLYKEAGYAWVGRSQFYVWKLLLYIAIFCLFLRRDRFFIVIKQGKFLVLFVVLTYISQYWSDAPSDTKTAAVKLIETTLMGAYICTRYNYKEQTDLFSWVFGIAAVLSIFYVFAQPSLGLMHKAGSELNGTWRGIYVHKNVLGRIMTIAGIFLLIKALTSHKKRWLWWLVFAISFQLILGTNSKTALVGFLFLLIISPFHRIFRWNSVIAVPLYLILVLVSGIGAQTLADNWNSALASINKDPTLTGRIPLWTVLLGYLGERPWLGYGLHGFWQGWKGKENASVWRTFGWLPSHAHNGFLDIVLDFGLIGSIVFLVAFVYSISQALKRVRSLHSLESLWPIGYLTFFIIMNQTQSVMVVPYSIYWIFFVVISMTPIEPSEQQSPPQRHSTPPAQTKDNIKTASK
ncbi:O-antigen ligase family protein [Argonema antarcticum]|uniref:O-antigen ligase family protein n=1 Tax=Argonema antarcticum TaxID=2942763 RepID=UPI00201388BE|nr:O-antigen ligase [Argonema antarcticum]